MKARLIQDQIELLGQNISTARKRRQLTQAQLATKAGLTRPLLARVEQGVASGIDAYFAALWAMGLEREFINLADPSRDLEGVRLERLRLPRRARPTQEDWDE